MSKSRGETALIENTLTKDNLIENTLTKDNPIKDHPGDRPPWKETILIKDHPDKRPSWKETI